MPRPGLPWSPGSFRAGAAGDEGTSDEGGKIGPATVGGGASDGGVTCEGV
jgi:hypothetical protein